MSNELRLIRLHEVMRLTGYGRSSIYSLLQSDPTFPRQVHLSATGRGAVAWPKPAVEAWIAAKIQATQGGLH